MSRTALAFALAAVLAAPAARAERPIEFADATLPTQGVLALTAAEGLPESGDFARVDAATQGALRRAATSMGFTGERGSKLDVPGIGGYERVLVIGTGKAAADALLLREVGGSVAQHLAATASPVSLLWGEAGSDAASQLAMGVALGQYHFGHYKSKPAPHSQAPLTLHTPAGAAAAADWQANWQPVARATAFARDLISEPANVLYPEVFVERVRAQARGLPVTLEVLDVPAMRRLGMEGILSVGEGSARPPRLLLVRYRGAGRDEAPLAFVGKGITFDSGGISIKPNDGMWKMKYDMAGAAAATATVLALAGRRAPVNAVAVAALAENMPSGTADRPGDVIRTASGKTFEVMSTDAEGRMVLSDALWYVQQHDKPRVILDIATLTGSIVTALGHDFAGIFSRHDNLAAQLRASGERAGERTWQMPLLDSYGKALESPIADMRNGGGRAGAGTAAWFLGEFVERSTPWVHVDIAGVAWSETGAATSPAGATGYGVRLFDQFVRDHYETASPGK